MCLGLPEGALRLVSYNAQVLPTERRPGRVGEGEDASIAVPYDELTLTYPGLTIKLLKLSGERSFRVVSMAVSSARLLVEPGVRLGMSPTQVRAWLGAPASVEQQVGQQIYSYGNNGTTGDANLYFRRGKLVRIVWESPL